MKPAGGRADRGIVVLGVLIMSISGGMLWLAGINYDGITGSAAAKIHPSTYLAVLLFGVAALRFGNPIGFVAAVGAARPGSLLLLIAGLLLLLQAVAIRAPGLAGAVDTFMLPGLFGLLLGGLPAACRQRTLAALETVVHIVLLLNACLGVAEFVLHVRVFPYRFDGAIYAYDTRATALQGHPLGNASVTAIYVVCLLSGGGRLSPRLRLAQVTLQLAALVAFGGRSALAVTALLGCALAARAVHRQLRTGRVALPAVAAVALAFVAVPLGFAALAANGTFDAITTRFTSDSASNGARLAMFELFAPFSFTDLLIGPDLKQVESARRVAGLELGLENPLIRFALYNGLLMTALLAAGVIAYLAEIVRWSRRGLFMPMVGIAILLNSFESLASKNILLAKLAVMLLALFAPDPPVRPRRDRLAPGPV